MNKIKITYEPEDDVLNIWLSKKLYDYAEDDNGVITHYTTEGEPVYIEVLEAKRLFKDLSFLKKSRKNSLSNSQSVTTHRVK